MANEYILQDLIDQYIKGELAGEALDKFKNRLREDQDFAKKVELQQMLVAELQAQRKAELKAYMSENAKVEYIQNIWSKKWMYASAAIFITAIGLYFALQRIESQPGLTKSDENSIEQVDSSEQAVATNEADVQDTAKKDQYFVNVEDTPDETTLAENSTDQDLEDVAETVTLNRLSNEEKAIASDNNEKVLKDSIVLVKQYDIAFVNVQEEIKANDSEVIKESAETISTKTRDGLFQRRKKNEAADKEVVFLDSTVANGKDIATQPETDDAMTDRLKPKANQRIQVEFWESVVKFKGYRYSGNNIQLYGIDTSTAISFKKYGDSLYINIAGTYFVLLGNNQYNKYVKVTDAALLNILSK